MGRRSGTITELLEGKIENAPKTTGVYLMLDKKGNVIYVGKAKDLKKRVGSYFKGKDSRAMVPFLVSRTSDLEFMVTKTEKEALILENNLIKKHRPRYNITLRDDKNFYSIMINTKERFPKFRLVRKIRKDGAKYFGPYSSSASVKKTLRYLHAIFPLRTCESQELRTKKRPCIEFQIKRCLAPCCNLVGDEEYKKFVDEAILFMEGQGMKLVSKFQLEMNEAANRFDFEKAAEIRDRIAAIEATLEKQRIVSVSFENRDIFGIHQHEDKIQACIIYVRNGYITGQRKFPILNTKIGVTEILSSLIKQYYGGGAIIPHEIIIPIDIEDKEIIGEWLTEKKGTKVSVVIPIRGEKKDLLDMAAANAENMFRTENATEVENDGATKIMMEKLCLKNLPEHIECFDISNIGGKYAVGSMVSFLKGEPDKSHYKRFRIKTKEDADDYGMMREVLERRYGKKERLPDLIIVDGGRGQLGVALSVLDKLKIEGPDVIGIAKESRTDIEKEMSNVRKDEDRIYIPNRKNPIYFSRQPKVLLLLQKIRDEAHRFAVTYHRKLKTKENFRSSLDDIRGIGDLRKNALLMHFKGVEGIRKASAEELEKVSGIGKKAAEKIFRHFNEQK
jgi:excinuclease ABC subunit C